MPLMQLFMGRRPLILARHASAAVSHGSQASHTASFSLQCSHSLVAAVAYSVMMPLLQSFMGRRPPILARHASAAVIHGSQASHTRWPCLWSSLSWVTDLSHSVIMRLTQSFMGRSPLILGHYASDAVIHGSQASHTRSQCL